MLMEQDVVDINWPGGVFPNWNDDRIVENEFRSGFDKMTSESFAE